MARDPNGFALLAKWSAIPAGRIRYFADADASCVKGIRRGVVFVMAFWSVPAVLMFRMVTEALKKHDPDGALDFVVVDTDGIAEFYLMPEFVNRLHGSGETACVCNGRILSTTLGAVVRDFEVNLKNLLQTCGTTVPDDSIAIR